MHPSFSLNDFVKYLNQYTIPFSGLKVGNHKFDFEVDEKFFACFEESEISNGKLHVTALLEKQSIMMILELKIEGTVNVSCDRCSEPFNLEFSANDKFYIKFSDEPIDDVEIIVLEHNEHELKLGQKIFELIILNLPFRRVHEEGKCNPEVLKNLEKYQTKEEDKKDDPRWELLKKIKFN